MNRCQAKTRKGKQCKNPALDDSDFCATHNPDSRMTLVESPQDTFLLKLFRIDIPLISLLIANIVPLFGVFFFGWDAFLLVAFYWAENLATGFYTILKIAFAKGHIAEKIFTIPFFTIHYGGFVGIHGLFVLSLFRENSFDPFPKGDTWPCFLVFVQILVRVTGQLYSAMPDNARIALAALFISHGISFGYHYIFKKEYKTTTAQKQMASPYPRIFVMHISIIAGAFLALAMGSPAAILVVLVILKTTLDVILHKRQHRKQQHA